jgi:hypothetical protein
MTNSKRQPYGLGSFVKKFTKPIKKVLKSPLGKVAALGLGSYFMPGIGAKASGGWGPWLSRIGGAFDKGRLLAPLVRNKEGEFSLGRAGLTGLGLAAVGTPLWQKIMKTGPYQEFEEETEDWDVQPSSIANIMSQAKDYYRDYDPYLSSLNYMSPKEFVNPTFYSATGGLAKLANGGGVAEAQAEQMLKMEYQKYRNQGGTMSYQQFKMQVLRQAQQQGPMAQGQPQMMKKGGRSGYALGDIVEKLSWASPGGAAFNLGKMMGEKFKGGDEVVTDQMEEIEGQTAGPQWYTELVEHFMYLGYDYDEASDMAWDVGHGKMELGDVPEKKATGGRIGAQEGGLMNLGGMEKDYRNEGGFVPIGGKEKADDVPARLSKNEFVFTADAVRNAGGGDIDAGAQVMENVMKNLEAGGEISEESQGAQGMYNNMKQLETRVA